MNSNDKNIEIFPLESIVTVEISGAFYARLTQLLLDHAMTRDTKSIGESYAHLQSNDPRDAYEYHLLTLSILVKEIEAQVKKENKFESVNESIFQKPDEDSDSDDPQSQSQPESQD